MNGLIKKKKQF